MRLTLADLRSALAEHGDALAYPSPGAYVHAFVRANLRGEHEEMDTLLRAVADVTTTSDAGLVPTIITGDLQNFVDSTRYVANAMRDLPMPPAGKTFNRPRVTQRTLGGVQATEFDELSSRALNITGDPLTKHTHGTVLNISEQDADWTSPEMLQIATEDMAESYAISTEAEAALAVETAVVHSTNDGTLMLNADAPTFHAAIATTAGKLYNIAKALPDTLFVAVDRWAYMVGLMDGNNRPLYPNLSPVNAPGQLNAVSWDGAPMGLKLVVSPAFRAGFTALGCSRYVEKYEQNKGLLAVAQPATLSVQIAYRGYFTTNVQTKGVYAMSELGADSTWDGDLT